MRQEMLSKKELSGLAVAIATTHELLEWCAWSCQGVKDKQGRQEITFFQDVGSFPYRSNMEVTSAFPHGQSFIPTHLGIVPIGEMSITLEEVMSACIGTCELYIANQRFLSCPMGSVLSLKHIGLFGRGFAFNRMPVIPGGLCFSVRAYFPQLKGITALACEMPGYLIRPKQ